MAGGTPPDIAQAVTESFVEANLAGHDSHGMLRLPWYVRSIREGTIHPDARAAVIRRSGATAVVDGALGWGQPAARLAAQTAVELAAESGVGAVTIVNCNHIGRLGEYVASMARAGMIGIALCNSSPVVAAYGGYRPVLGTNPLAWAAPRGGGHPPVVLDVRTRSQYAQDDMQIPGSVRAAPDRVEEWVASATRERSVVAYCT